MILYCDTSALVKRYVKETHSEELNLYWGKSFSVATSVVAYAESIAAFRRKLQARGYSRGIYQQLVDSFTDEYAFLILVPITAALNQQIVKLLNKYSLRGFDAIHLASSIVLQERGASQVSFACFDQRLNAIAREEKLTVVFD